MTQEASTIKVPTGLTKRQLRCDDEGRQEMVIVSDDITTATLSNVAAAASSVTVLAANASRRRVIIHNDSPSKLRLKFGATASLTSFTLALNAYETYESPSRAYKGIIDGIWDSATGSARVTEMV
jgi:hypothetical protein